MVQSMADDGELRVLQQGDSVRVRELNAVFGRAFFEPETYEPGAPSDEYVEAWLGNSNHIAIVALDSGVVVGGLTAYVLDKLERARREIYIYDLAVAQEHRRRGIATALIGRLKEIARELGAYVIFVQADLGDDAAIALYEKLGAREDVLHFDIAVTPPQNESPAL